MVIFFNNILKLLELNVIDNKINLSFKNFNSVLFANIFYFNLLN